MKKFLEKNKVLLMYIVLVVVLAGCGREQGEILEDTTDETISYIDAGISQIDNVSVIDNSSIYSADDEDSIAYFYITVRYGSEAKGTNHTFAEVNNVERFVDGVHTDVEIMADALIQAGDENGPREGMLGYGETGSNATIRVRGNSSTRLAVKSYRVKLDDDAGLWRGQSNIALNKHAFDVTRFRNKLYFDTLREIDAVPSIRTQFAVVYIKDETAGETEFTNYGIFTQAEVPSKKYLANHGMDSNGYLYKAISFNFEPNDALKNFDDPSFDLEAMEEVISCRGREDNQKLIDVVNVISDTSIDINYIIDTYFDRDNYEYWLAYNILMGNLDTTVQNFYLYSPINGNKWYFIPWDGDASLFRGQWALTGEDKNYDTWECGISNYWGILLHQRFLKYDSNRKELDEKIEELHSWLNKDYISQMADMYNSTIEEYVLQMPDILHLGYTTQERDYIIETLGDEVENNYQKYKESLNALMPFYMYEAYQLDDKVIFSWGDAYDFNAGKLTYSLTVSKFFDMSSPIISVDNMEELVYEADESLFEDGEYYWKVVANGTDGRATNAFNQMTVLDENYDGISSFYFDSGN